MDICGKRGQQLAVIVKRDIWSGALPFLHRQRIAHCDIHQSNVVVCLEQGKAVLIDFESAKEFEQNLSECPIRNAIEGYASPGATVSDDVDKIAVAALLECLWRTEHYNFDKMEDQIQKVSKEKRRNYSIVQTIEAYIRPLLIE